MLKRTSAAENQGNNSRGERSNHTQIPTSSPESSMSTGGYTNGPSSNNPPPLPPHGVKPNISNINHGDTSTSQGTFIIIISTFIYNIKMSTFLRFS